MQKLSLVIPFYNEGASVKIFFERLFYATRDIKELAIEYVCVDDGSGDDTEKELKKCLAHEQIFTIVMLSRNFGKEAALTAGLAHCTGDAVVMLDADLQDPPELLADMVNKWREGYEVVLCERRLRNGDTFFKRASAKMFYKIFNAFSSIRIPENVGDFRLMDRVVVDAVLALPENQRFMKGLFSWVGFNSVIIKYDRPKRADLQSKQSVLKLINLAFIGLTSHGPGLLRVWTMFGLLMSTCCLLYVAFVFIRVALIGVDVPGYASVITAVIFFGSLQMIGVGLVGEYLGRILLEAKRRPTYIVRDIVSSN